MFGLFYILVLSMLPTLRERLMTLLNTEEITEKLKSRLKAFFMSELVEGIFYLNFSKLIQS